MGYHHNPIEPSDWTHGPDDRADCTRCEGLGTVEDEDNEGQEKTCPRCGGTGAEPYEHFEDDVI